MDLNEVATSIADVIRSCDVGVVPVGGGTHATVANPARSGCVAVSVPSGIVSYDPADMTVTVLAGTTVAELSATLAEHQQEVPLDPRSAQATVGGVLACGLSGRRRLHLGPVRDTLLEVRMVDGVGTLIKGGGQVVKNVTGYDIPRLFVGSFGTLGVLVQCTMRCRPMPSATQWYVTDRDPFTVRDALFRPSSILFNGTQTHVLIEGYPDDLVAEAARAGLMVGGALAPDLPDGVHRGRISVAPSTLESVGSALTMCPVPLRWQSEIGVGTVHVACDDPEGLVRARTIAETHDGWLLRESGGPDRFDGFGVAMPNDALMQRVRSAFDPRGVLAPGRLPFADVIVRGAR